MPLITSKPKILAGQSLSEPIDASGGTPLFVMCPVQWTPANMSFQLSADGVTWADMFDHAGREIIRPVVAGTSIPFGADGPSSKGAHMKIRSGSRDFPIVQAAEREFTVAIET